MTEFSLIWKDGKLYKGTYEMSPKHEYANVTWEIWADDLLIKTVVITPEVMYTNNSMDFWSRIFKEQ